MIKRKIKILKVVVLILSIILLIRGVLNSIGFYQYIVPDDNAFQMIFMFILGAIIGLIIKGGLTFVFWNSYEIKYGKDNQKYRRLKKAVASFLFLSIISTLFGGADLFVVFVLCTLIIEIRKYKIRESI